MQHAQYPNEIRDLTFQGEMENLYRSKVTLWPLSCDEDMDAPSLAFAI
jgi:hypothetical protein